MARTGRRPGPTSSRHAILLAATRRFAAAGFDATSLRVIAADAGVDPAVVLHFFGSKEGLFRAAVGWPFDPELLATRLRASPELSPGTRLASVFLGVWDDPVTRSSLTAVLRSAMSHPASAALLREFAGRMWHASDIFGRLVADVGEAQAERRMDLAAAHLLGVALFRYVLGIEPLASAATETLVGWLAPALDRHLRPDPPPTDSLTMH